MPRARLCAKVYWCSECNVPLIGKECNRCGSEGFRIHLTPPGDVRPALRADLESIRNALVNETGIDCFNDIIGNGKFVLVNRIRYVDVMKEVIADGVRIGKVYYEPLTRRWRFRWSYAGATRAIDKGIVDYLVVRDHDKLREGLVIRRKFVDPGEQLILVDKELEPVGVAYGTRKGIRIKDVFVSRSIPMTSEKTATIQDAIKANERMLLRYEGIALMAIEKVLKKFDLRTVVMFSGGKDSTVVLHLALESGAEPQVLFNDTGMEIPDTYEFVDRILDKLGIDIITIKPDKSFWEYMKTFGPPAVDYRWCTNLLKLIPTCKYVRNRWPQGVLSIDGRRAYESVSRSKISLVWRSSWIPQLLCISPMRDWYQLIEWLFIFWKRIDYNKLYDEGFDRIGCFMCPNCTLNELDYVMRRYPDVWSSWHEELLIWQRRLKMPREWVEYALWQWLRPSVAYRNLVEHLHLKTKNNVNYRSWRALRIEQCKVEENKVRVIFNRPLNEYLTLMCTDGWKECGEALYKRDNAILEVHDKVLIVTSRDNLIEHLSSALRLIYRSALCVKCKSCVQWCEKAALQVMERPIVREELCSSCGICNYVCPIAELLVNMLILELNLKLEVDYGKAQRVLKKFIKPLPVRRIPHEEPQPSWDILLGFE
ncbi:MAG: hypothetical protein DRN15_08035 [Thermoprotei archaeon]|nr:MAG: hypothetical protein DRN15_08035 [Thermoprotei archaeon]